MKKPLGQTLPVRGMYFYNYSTGGAGTVTSGIHGSCCSCFLLRRLALAQGPILEPTHASSAHNISRAFAGAIARHCHLHALTISPRRSSDGTSTPRSHRSFVPVSEMGNDAKLAQLPRSTLRQATPTVHQEEVLSKRGLHKKTDLQKGRWFSAGARTFRKDLLARHTLWDPAAACFCALPLQFL